MTLKENLNTLLVVIIPSVFGGMVASGVGAGYALGRLHGSAIEARKRAVEAKMQK